MGAGYAGNAPETGLTVRDEQGRDLVPIEGTEEACKVVRASNTSEKIKRACLRIAAGATTREATEAEECKSQGAVYNAAKRYGILDLKTAALITKKRGIAFLADEEIERRLLDPERAAEIGDIALNAYSGTSTDKVVDYEKAKGGGLDGFVSALERVAKEFIESGKSLEISVAVHPSGAAEHEVIDVTPSEPT